MYISKRKYKSNLPRILRSFQDNGFSLNHLSIEHVVKLAEKVAEHAAYRGQGNLPGTKQYFAKMRGLWLCVITQSEEIKTIYPVAMTSGYNLTNVTYASDEDVARKANKRGVS